MNKDELRDLWKSLGVAFEVGEIKFLVPPEEIILATISSPEFPENKQMIRLMLGWLRLYKEFVHLERLKALAPKSNAYALAVLGGVAQKQAEQGDHRWKTIAKVVKKVLAESPLANPPADPQIQIERKGMDADFNDFGLRIVATEGEAPRKYRSRQFILQQNPWLKNRLFFGTN